MISRLSAPPAADGNRDILAGLPLFQEVEASILENLAAAAHCTEHGKGAVFLAQGDAVHYAYIVLDGWCGASKGNLEGQESILQIFRPGDFLPEPELSPSPQAAALNLVALTPARLLLLPVAVLRDALVKSPAFSANMLAASVQRCQQLRDHIEQLTLHNAEQRVGHFLLQIRFDASAEGDKILLPFDKSLLASYLGIKPETLSRTLQFFKENGFHIDRNRLTLPDGEALCDYCDQTIMKSCHFAHTDRCTHSAHNDAAID